jgi:hypothetical protein
MRQAPLQNTPTWTLIERLDRYREDHLRQSLWVKLDRHQRSR